jgi:signal peptidase II
MTSSRRLFLILLTALATVGCDQATKVVARDHLVHSGPLSYAGDMFRLHYAENRGAFLSLGSNLPDGLREGIFTVGAGLMLVALFTWLLLSPRMSPWNTLALALLCGGGVGNLIDRILRDGRVIDFLNLGIGGLRTGIFNVADIAITMGLIMLLLGGFRRDRQSPESPSGTADHPAPSAPS